MQAFLYKKSHWLTRPVTHTLGIKKIEETSYNEQMNFINHLLHDYRTTDVILRQ